MANRALCPMIQQHSSSTISMSSILLQNEQTNKRRNKGFKPDSLGLSLSLVQ